MSTITHPQVDIPASDEAKETSQVGRLLEHTMTIYNTLNVVCKPALIWAARTHQKEMMNNWQN